MNICIFFPKTHNPNGFDKKKKVLLITRPDPTERNPIRLMFNTVCNHNQIQFNYCTNFHTCFSHYFSANYLGLMMMARLLSSSQSR